MSAARPAAYFEALYAQNPDPWGFESSPYEAAKYAATLAALGRPNFGAALEVGCSIGVLTEKLAARCGHLLAVDISPTALAKARARCAGLAHVSFLERAIPQGWPAGRFDLILFSEILYFLSAAAIRTTAALAASSLAPGGEIVLVNFTGVIDEPVSGDMAADIFAGAAAQRVWVQRRADKFRIDVLS
jgi:SAM-dependent methyltransferase